MQKEQKLNQCSHGSPLLERYKYEMLTSLFVFFDAIFIWNANLITCSLPLIRFWMLQLVLYE